MEGLTAYEMLDLAMGHVNAATDDSNRALALGSAYLLCAYKAGRNLTRFQVSIINVGFIVLVGQALYGSAQEFVASIIYYRQVEDDAWAYTNLDSVPEFLYWIGACVSIGAVLACLSFMWSVRHPKTE